LEHNINLSSYTIRFAIAYCIGLIIVAGIFYIFDLEHSSGASVGVLIGAAMFSASKFIQDNHRLPSKTEKSRLIWQSFLVSWLVTLVLLLVMVIALGGLQVLAEMSQLASRLSVTIVAGVIIFASLVQWAVLYFSYGSLAKKQYEALVKKGKIQP
jgi:hypothetical protein